MTVFLSPVTIMQGCSNPTPGASKKGPKPEAKKPAAPEKVADKPKVENLKKTAVISLQKIRFDNGAEIGINDGRTLYFNGLPRSLKNGVLHIGSKKTKLDWAQTFGFDAVQGQNGKVVEVGNKKYVEVHFTGSLGAEPKPGHDCKGCFCLEMVDQDGGTHQLWFRHEDKGLVNFKPVEGKPGYYRAEIPEGVTGISKVQFVGFLTNINIALHSIDLVE